MEKGFTSNSLFRKRLNKTKTHLKVCNKGFTLMELLVVAAIVAILASIAFLLIDPISQFKKTNNTQRYMGQRQLADALELYFNDYGQYPPDFSTLVSNQYLKKVPVDPETGSNYIYELAPGNNWAVIYGTYYKKGVRDGTCTLPLDTDPTCKPINYDRTDDYVWGCKVLGQINCNEVKTYNLP